MSARAEHGRRSHLRRAAGSATLGLLLLVGSAAAQTQVQQTGRMFEVNPLVGGGGYNYTRAQPVSPLLPGNALAGGNVGRGFSLRSYSPVPGYNTFRGALGSSSLSNFTRDSIAVSDAYSAYNPLAPRLYFDPARTVPSGRFLQGYLGTGTAQSNTGGTSSRIGVNPWGGMQYGAPPQPRQPTVWQTTPLDPLKGGPAPNLATLSPIFGVTQPSIPAPWSQQGGLPQAPRPTAPRPSDEDLANLSPGQAPRLVEPLDLRLWADQPTAAPRSYLDVFSRQSASEMVLGTRPEQAERPGITTPGMYVPEQRGGVVFSQRQDQVANQPAAPVVTIRPGADKFADMRMAMELSRNPQAEWFAEMLRASSGQPAAPSEGPTFDERAAEEAARFISQVLSAPLRSFVGEDKSQLNRELMEAEAAMDLRDFREAIVHYERAAQADPANPLPLIGKAHAQLAMGRYVSAVTNLLAGLRRFPELGEFRIDLTALMGSGEIVDIRRSDLMKRLAAREDVNLRFLLGYIEVNTGMAESGWRNLARAARQAPPGSVVRRYAEIVRRRLAREGLIPAESSTLLEPAAGPPAASRPAQTRENPQ